MVIRKVHWNGGEDVQVINNHDNELYLNYMLYVIMYFHVKKSKTNVDGLFGVYVVWTKQSFVVVGKFIKCGK